MEVKKMENNSNELNSKIIYEVMISLKNNKFDILLSINENHLLFQKKKGIINKKYRIIKDILLKDIKIVNGKVKIEQKKNNIVIYTNNEKVEFKCNNSIEGKLIVEHINKLLLKENFLERTSRKGIKILNITKNTAKIVGGVALAVAGTYSAIKESKDVIKEVANTLFIKRK